MSEFIEEHILVCLSSAPSNEKIIRMASRMAKAFNGKFTALFVETPDFQVATLENKRRLSQNQQIAQSLGAKVETVYGEDIPFQIAEYARLSNVTKIVLGRSAIKKRRFFGKPSFTEQLLSYVPEIDIHIIPDINVDGKYRPRRIQNQNKQSILIDSIKSLLILIGATLLSLLFYRFGFTDSNIIMVYILGVLLTSVATSHQLYSLVSSIASVIIFNYFFTAPRFSLAVFDTGYPVTFVVMFLTAYITGNFALRYKEQARQYAKIAYRTKVLFDTNQLLSKATGKEEIMNSAIEQLSKLLERNIVFFENENDCLSKPVQYPYQEDMEFDDTKEIPCANWVLQNNHVAGATTDMFYDLNYIYFSIRLNNRVYGVIGIDVKNNSLDALEHEILLSILGEMALALENERNAREKEAAAILAESEQLRANLLRAISHDLRTPLTTISGNADNLMKNGDLFDDVTKKEIYSDIYNDSVWLINLVENLLYATRFEEGKMKLQCSDELLIEIVDSAIQHVNFNNTNHQLKTICEDDLLLVRADAKLVIQVIINIIDNAIKYTPMNTTITIKQFKNGNYAQIEIMDCGKGIPDSQKDKIFDKFYSGDNKIVDNRRSIGLGLYLCKAVIEAHGGQIYVRDNIPTGSVFVFTLPLKEIEAYE